MLVSTLARTGVEEIHYLRIADAHATPWLREAIGRLKGIPESAVELLRNSHPVYVEVLQASLVIGEQTLIRIQQHKRQ